MQLRPYGSRAALADVASPTQAAALAAWARDRVEAAEIVPAARTVLFDGVVSLDALRSALAGWIPTEEPPPGPLVEIPVVYDGPDLAFVADAWSVSVGDVARRMGSVELVSAFCGFAPGFAYLAGLPPQWQLSRLETPRSRVPAGSVALAGEWCGVYPAASPGGWRIVGHTATTLWDPTRESPALLAPGTRVRFRDASSLGAPTHGLSGAGR